MAETERGTGLTRGGALDALRFAAAAFITLYHFGQEEGPRPLGDFIPAFERGYLATDFFLLLSGYVLARTYGPRILAGRTGAGAFLLGRFTRLWPAHVVVLLSYLAVVVAAGLVGLGLNHAEAFSLQRFVPQLFLVHAWGLGATMGWNSATWTLSALLVCYAVFPSLWRGLARLTPGAALAAGVAALLAADLAARGFGADIYKLDPAIGVARGLPLFVLGAAVARFGQSFTLSGAQGLAVGLGGALALVASQSVPGLTFISILAIAAVILAAGSHKPRQGSSFVASAAALSFALFLTHNLVGLVWFRLPGLLPWSLGEPLQWAWWAAGLTTTLIAAAVFHHWIDTPLQSWLKPRLSRGIPAGAITPAAAPI
jgi:peptidoglycan/LPS O-acetylase OafA/YrhL